MSARSAIISKFNVEETPLPSSLSALRCPEAVGQRCQFLPWGHLHRLTHNMTPHSKQVRKQGRMPKTEATVLSPHLESGILLYSVIFSRSEHLGGGLIHGVTGDPLGGCTTGGCGVTHILRVGVQSSTTALENWHFLPKLKICLSYELAPLCLGNSKRNRVHIPEETCI